MNVKAMSYRERVDYGRRIECRILRALDESGYHVRLPTDWEDMYAKVDGHIEWKGRYRPLQVKYRSGGPDFLMEVSFLDSGSAFDGRDFISKAQVYASLCQDMRTIRLCCMDELRELAVRMTRELLKKRNRRVFSVRGVGQVRRTVDGHSGRCKIIFFAKPEGLSSVREIKLKKPISAL